MRYLLLLISLFLPSELLAQYGSFEAGSYVLAAHPNVRQQGEIKLQKTGLITVKDSDKNKTDYTTNEVISFRVGKHRFYVDSNFAYPNWVRKKDRVPAFTEVVDSGRVVLLSIYLESGGGATNLGRGMVMTNAPVYTACYFIRQAPGTAAEIASKELMITCLTDRPDLTKLASAKWLSKERIVEEDSDRMLIHLLNTGQPYVPPLTHYELLKQQALAKRAHKGAAADSARH